MRRLLFVLLLATGLTAQAVAGKRIFISAHTSLEQAAAAAAGAMLVIDGPVAITEDTTLVVTNGCIVAEPGASVMIASPFCGVRMRRDLVGRTFPPTLFAVTTGNLAVRNTSFIQRT